MRFNTIGVSDGISMGTDGMSYSLQSRDLIADSIETIMGAQWYDALITLPGCDKNMPGCVMAMGRLNRPAIMIYGGTIKPGCSATTGGSGRGRRGQAGHRFGVPVLRPVRCRQDYRRAAARDRPQELPRGRRLRRHVHRQHNGQRNRSDGGCRSPTPRRSRRRTRTSSTSVCAPARRSSC